MTLDTVGEVIAEQGFVTVQEPACGAGGMMIAAADAIERRGFDIGRQLYVDGTDISAMCFKMTYLQASLRGIPATIRRGNTLALETFDQAVTPAFLGFYATHRESFDAWRRGEGGGTASYDAEITQQNDATNPDKLEPIRPTPPAPSRQHKPGTTRQLSLFDDPA